MQLPASMLLCIPHPQDGLMLVYLEEGELKSESGAPVTPGECANPGCASFLPYRRVKDVSHVRRPEVSLIIPPSCPVPLTQPGA